MQPEADPAAVAPSLQDEPAPGARVEAIVNGVADHTSAVVYIFNRVGALCTGTLISPRVVLTAKHCVQASGASGPYAPSFFVVGVGDSLRAVSESRLVQDVRTTPGVFTAGASGGLSGALVGQDIGLLVLAMGFTGVEPIPVHRGSPTELISRTLTAVGYGQTPRGETGVKYRTDIDVRGVQGGVIFSSPKICQGDSGGPLLIPDTNEVAGVASFGQGACGSGVVAGHNRLDTYLDMIDEIVRESGTCINDGAEVCDGYDNDCNDQVDEGCLELGDDCETSERCGGGTSCEDTPTGRRCTVSCDPLRPRVSCPPDRYCAHAGGCDGFCVPGAPGELGVDRDCEADTDCVSLFCADPGDGRRRCLEPCRGDAGMCLSGDVCAANPNVCGGCVAEDIVRGLRGLGEPCGDGVECHSGQCLDEADQHYCTRACEDDAACGAGFHCRETQCVRGNRAGVGGPCVRNGDCEDGALCAARGGVRWCSRFCSDEDPCPDGFDCVDAGGARVCAPGSGLVGEDCSEPDDCVSGLCASTAGGDVCTQLCGAEAPCGPGLECRYTADGTMAVCLSPTPPGGGGGDEGCAVASVGASSPGRRTDSAWHFAMAFFGVLALGAFRRRSRR